MGLKEANAYVKTNYFGGWSGYFVMLVAIVPLFKLGEWFAQLILQ